MNHIGNLIKEYRSRLGISRNELASGLCSATYVYLIEKGERTPSSDLLRQFSDKLGIDLFNLYQYLDCSDPVKVHETILLFEKYKRNSEFKNLIELTDAVRDHPDFTKAPWRCEIAINKYTCMVLVDGDVYKAIEDLKRMIDLMNRHNCLDKHIAQILSLLSISYQIIGEVQEAEKALEAAMQLMNNKSNMNLYKQVIITTKLSYLFMCLKDNRHEMIIAEGISLLEYQTENNLSERTHYTYYLLSIAYYKLGHSDEAARYFRNVIYSTLIQEKPFDTRNFLEEETFIKLINSDLIDRRMIREFCQKYQIDRDQYKIDA